MLSFPLNIYLAALAVSFALSALSVPFWISWCSKHGLVDDPGHRKIHHTPVPLAGGWAILSALVLLLLLGMMLFGWPGFAASKITALTHGVHRRLPEISGLIAGALGMLILGWQDDRRELRAGPKFLGQCACALAAAFSGFILPVVPGIPWIGFLATMLWVLTVTNAMNFMDNMNGLCGGLSAIACFGFGVRAATHGQYLVATLAFMFCGAIAGFLPFNFPKGRAFLGDTGSHLLGYLLSVLPLAGQAAAKPHESAAPFPAALIMLAVPLLDLAWVVLLRWKLGKPFYIGDTNHLSHRMVRAGMTPITAVLSIWLLAALAAFLACLN